MKGKVFKVCCGLLQKSSFGARPVGLCSSFYYLLFLSFSSLLFSKTYIIV